MRSALKFALLFLCLLTALDGPCAKAADDYGNTVLVSPEQGEALAAFALQAEKRIRPKPDCSHLVNLLYARAGLIYPYEDSRVLYRGVSDFQAGENTSAWRSGRVAGPCRHCALTGRKDIPQFCALGNPYRIMDGSALGSSRPAAFLPLSHWSRNRHEFAGSDHGR